MIINNYLPFMINPENEENKALFLKNQWSLIYYNFLSNILNGLFDYENLDENNIDRINKSFFFYGYCGCINDEKLGILFSPVTPTGNPDIFGNYTEFQFELLNKKIYTLDKNIAVGKNFNLNYITDNMICWKYATQLADCKLSILNATILSRYAINIVGDENSVRQNAQIYNDYELGKINFFTADDINESFKPINFVLPTTLEDYYNTIREIINEFLEITGFDFINNPSKKERLIVDEINKNDIKSTLLIQKIRNREKFIDKVNDLFGTNIKLKIADVTKTNFDTIFENVDNVDNSVNLEKDGD
ncbi:MAG: hypothetical protein J6T10_26015 [Methanobrevibacter sp.]|nr:hypothetical protein [Methanobrevibacter sp.]